MNEEEWIKWTRKCMCKCFSVFEDLHEFYESKTQISSSEGKFFCPWRYLAISGAMLSCLACGIMLWDGNLVSRDVSKHFVLHKTVPILIHNHISQNTSSDLRETGKWLIGKEIRNEAIRSEYGTQTLSYGSNRVSKSVTYIYRFTFQDEYMQLNICYIDFSK
jgi:hypothetical protein